jgi:uncharacterized protein (DUF983 family)
MDAMKPEDREKLRLVRPAAAAAASGRLAAILAGRCPRCRVGPIFEGRFRMREGCPACGLVFGREPGYFTGAMYLSYALAVPLLAMLTLLAHHLLWPALRLEAAIGVALVPFVLFVPWIFRYSRILWIHLDRAIDPGEDPGA